MQTFTISKTQAQNYYAIRIFGMVHQLMGAGLVVLMDGPSDGLRGFSWFLLVAIGLSTLWLLLRIYQAAVWNRIYGHYVLTKNTLAIKLPGARRVFVRRRNVVGLVPYAWTLVLRGKVRISLRSASSRMYLGELVEDLCQKWWPGFAGTAVWKSFTDESPRGTLDVRVDFRSCGDPARPMLVFTPGARLYVWQGAFCIAALAGMLVYAMLLPYSWGLARTLGDAVPWVVGLVNVLGGLLCVLVCAGVAVHLIYWICFRQSLRRAFVVTGRCLASVQAGTGVRYVGKGSASYYTKVTGLLGLTDGRQVLLSPYYLGGGYGELIHHLFSYWWPRNTAVAHKWPFGSSNRLLEVFLWAQFIGYLAMTSDHDLSARLLGDSPALLVCYAFLHAVALVWLVFMGVVWTRRDVSEQVELSRSESVEGT